jgi:hypothetical protein
LEAVVGVLLGGELLDDLVDIADSGGVLDPAHLFVEANKFVFVRKHPNDLVLLLASSGVSQGCEESCRLVPSGLVTQLAGVLVLAFPLAQWDNVLFVVDEFSLLVNFLLSVLPLGVDLRLKLTEVGLGEFLSVVGVMRQQEELFEIVFLSLETLLDGGQLVIIPDSLVFQSLDDKFVGLFDAHCFVVLDHSLVQPVLQHPDRSHLGVVVAVQVDLLFVQLPLLVLQIQKLLLLS